jgi:N-acetylglucosaminyldiphosphoundecaprenol N-acetyl-beta-D-mannosaminyltransferase
MLSQTRPVSPSPPTPASVPAVGAPPREWALDPAVEALVRAVPRVPVAGMPVAALDMEETAELMIAAARVRTGPARPLYLTSTNGEVISRCARDPSLDRLFRIADAVSADGQPMVFASCLPGRRRLPERVATTDLFHAVARRAEAEGLSFYLYGADEEENRRAVATVRALYPRLRIAGRSHGYHKGEALDAKLDEIDALAPDILWLALGVPREQAFAVAYARRLRNVGVIKTSGGLFNFLSGRRRRAPAWLQRVGLEWTWRLALEPGRLLVRYATTSPHALFLLLLKAS